MRSSAIWRLVNFSTGMTPGKPFQIAASRFNGHSPAILSHSSLLAINR
jgi:hypothetical protein